MKTWITSDLHFGHTNIMKFCPLTRPYDTVEDMNRSMIFQWNLSVAPEDETFIIGDFAFCNAQEAVKILKSLNGTKILITGNHDEKLIKSAEFNAQFTTVTPYLETTYDKRKLIMFHFPIVEWNRCHHGSYHLYGHLHGKPSGLESFRAMDVGMDSTGCVVSSLDRVLSTLKDKPFKAHGDGN